MPGTILVVDDDAHIRDVVGFALEKAGYRTVAAADGAAALAAAAAHAPDLIVLDINMPEVDGLEVCRRLRQTSEVPVLFLSSRDEEVDRIVGLELGGDDYVAKPFSPRELVARVKAILKRLKAPAPADDGALAHGALRLDPAGHQAWFGAAPVALTATEFTLLHELLRRPLHVRTRNSLIDAAYGPGFHLSDRTVDSHIRHIRTKFEAAGGAAVIETVHGVGYKLGACT